MYRRHKIKLGIVIGSMQRGGAEMQLAQLLPRLKQSGLTISVFVIGPMGPVADDLRNSDIAVIGSDLPKALRRLPALLRRPLRTFWAMPQLLAFALRHRHGILHLYLPEAVISGGLLAVWWHKRVVASQRGLITYRHKYPFFVAAIERYVFRNCRALVANSEGVRRALHADGLGREIGLIYNGIGPERLDPPNAEREAVRAELGIAHDEWVLVVLANLHPYKGHVDLIEALIRLKAEDALPARWRLILIGRDIDTGGAEVPPDSKTSWRSHLHEICREHDLDRHVLFLGERKDGVRLLRAADIGVLPSHEEGFSNALLEMMGAGLAIIATDVGGNAEALGGEAGLIVPAQDPKTLMQALQRLQDRPLRAMHGAKARRRVETEFSLETCVRRHLDFYQSLMPAGEHFR
jgi:glycosyltransferase involved in cell wall biosynthesis